MIVRQLSVLLLLTVECAQLLGRYFHCIVYLSEYRHWAKTKINMIYSMYDESSNNCSFIHSISWV